MNTYQQKSIRRLLSISRYMIISKEAPKSRQMGRRLSFSAFTLILAVAPPVCVGEEGMRRGTCQVARQMWHIIDVARLSRMPGTSRSSDAPSRTMTCQEELQLSRGTRRGRGGTKPGGVCLLASLNSLTTYAYVYSQYFPCHYNIQNELIHRTK